MHVTKTKPDKSIQCFMDVIVKQVERIEETNR